ncbi:MAG: family 20 glycosylhydrolase, partial [Aggregatilineales bacterium]
EDTESEPAAIGGYVSLERAYLFQPVPADIDPEKAHHVIGGQGNVWTEYIPTEEQVEYMTYPRAIALAEILWAYPEKRDFAAFTGRVKQHLPRLNNLEVGYRLMQDDD